MPKMRQLRTLWLCSKSYPYVVSLLASEGTSLEFFGLVLAIPFCLATKDSDSHLASPAECLFLKKPKAEVGNLFG